MKQISILFALVFGVLAGAGSARGQTSRQVLNFAIYAEYATNKFSTNHVTTDVTTNQTIAASTITTSTIVRDIAIDMFGAGYTNWTSALLYRETDAAGHEGIFLFKPMPPTNVNVSSFFGLSFTNDFGFQTANNYTPIANINGVPDFSAFPDYNDVPPPPATAWGDITNYNFHVLNPVQGGDYIIQKVAGKTQVFTNFLGMAPSTVGLCYLSLQTMNLQLNILGSGATTTSRLIGSLPGAPLLYTNLVQTLAFNFGIGTYRENMGTNLLAPVAGSFDGGPAHGYFSSSAPFFSVDPAAVVFPP